MMARSAVVLVILAGLVSTASAEVWTGPTVTFAKAGSDDPALPENQDPLTPNVAITRQSFGGLFNAVTESTFDRNISPIDTEWAFAELDGNPMGIALNAEICAAVEGTCQFSNWWNAQGSGTQGQNLVGRPAVVHLLTDDIYLDLMFTEWANATSGGAMAYERTTSNGVPPVPVPSSRSGALVLLALLTALAVKLVRRRMQDEVALPQPQRG
jgi:hypothetical protein